MSYPIKEILKRARDTMLKPEAEQPEWENPISDAIFLALVVERVVGDLRRANDRLPEGMRYEELCKICGSHTWGRPPGEDGTGMDFTRRICSVCGEIRQEPAEQVDLNVGLGLGDKRSKHGTQ